MKVCRTCGDIKRLEEYPTQRKTGFRGDAATVTLRQDCKECVAKAAREYRRLYVSVPKVQIGLDDEKYLVSAIGCRCSDAKQRAARSGTKFDIDTAYMYRLYQEQEGKCALTGFPLTTAKNTPDVLSIDQKFPGAGYTQGNVQWVTWAVNRAKGDYALPEFLSMCAAVIGRCNDYPEREYSQVAGSAQRQ